MDTAHLGAAGAGLGVHVQLQVGVHPSPGAVRFRHGGSRGETPIFARFPPGAPGTRAAIRPRNTQRGTNMRGNLSELPLGSGDPLWPLRFLDARFEPRDPIFDPEEVEEEPRQWRRKKRLSAALVAAAIAGCGGPSVPATHATDAVLVQLEEGASPPAGRAAPESGPPIVALESLAPDAEPAVLRAPIEPGTDPVVAAEQ